MSDMDECEYSLESGDEEQRDSEMDCEERRSESLDQAPPVADGSVSDHQSERDMEFKDSEGSQMRE